MSHLTGVTPRSEKDVNMFEAATTEGYKICLSGRSCNQHTVGMDGRDGRGARGRHR